MKLDIIRKIATTVFLIVASLFVLIVFVYYYPELNYNLNHPFVIAISVTLLSGGILAYFMEKGKATLKEITERRLTHFQYLHQKRAEAYECIYRLLVDIRISLGRHIILTK